MPILAIMAGILAISIGVATLGFILQILFALLPYLIAAAIVATVIYILFLNNKLENSKINYPSPPLLPHNYAARRIAILKEIEKRNGLTELEKKEMADLERMS